MWAASLEGQPSWPGWRYHAAKPRFPRLSSRFLIFVVERPDVLRSVAARAAGGRRAAHAVRAAHRVAARGLGIVLVLDDGVEGRSVVERLARAAVRGLGELLLRRLVEERNLLGRQVAARVDGRRDLR